MPARKLLVTGALLMAAAVVSLGAAGCGQQDQKAPSKVKKATPVTIGQASARRVVYTLDQVGTLESPKMVTLRAETAAPITAILFQEGKPVKEGQILVKQDTAKLKATAQNLEQRIQQLKIRLAHQKRILERNKPLVKDNLVSKLKYDDLETEIKVTETTLSQAQSDLTRHKDLMEDADIRAPFDGVAGSRDISVGDYLKVGDKGGDRGEPESPGDGLHGPRALQGGPQRGSGGPTHDGGLPRARLQGPDLLHLPGG